MIASRLFFTFIKSWIINCTIVNLNILYSKMNTKNIFYIGFDKNYTSVNNFMKFLIEQFQDNNNQFSNPDHMGNYWNERNFELNQLL